MKRILFYSVFIFLTFHANSQTCEEIMEYVKTEGYGTSYSSYNSDAISKVTFYDMTVDYQSYYFAIVCFKSKYPYGCT